MRRSDFHYELPAELIAQHPAPERTGSRLMVPGADPEDRRFSELPALLRPGDLLVFLALSQRQEVLELVHRFVGNSHDD